MLRKDQRLTRDHFKDLQTSRRSFHSEHFLLRVVDSPLGPRIGISVSKKTAKKASTRNRIRRRAYAAVAPLIAHLEKRLYLIIAKNGADGLKGEKLKGELALLLKKS